MAEDGRTRKSDYEHFENATKMHESPTGFQLMVNDNPNKPSMRIRTPQGTMYEFRSDGSVQKLTVGDNIDYNKSGSTCTTDENCDSKTIGHSRSMTGGGSHSEQPGDSGGQMSGSVAIVVMGKANIRCQQAYIGSDGDMNINAGGNVSMKVKGNMTMETQGTHTVKAGKIDLNPA